MFGPLNRAAWARRLLRLRRWLPRYAYLGLAGIALLVVTRTVEFRAPSRVRTHGMNAAELVGEAPAQEFAPWLSNPQAIQVRATLRLYPEPTLPVALPDPELDRQGILLSQPVVTTIFGLQASIEQTVRLEGGDLEVDLALQANPRRMEARGASEAASVSVEHELSVRSRRTAWWQSKPLERTHVYTQGVLAHIDQSGHRMVFAVDQHLLSLDLEISHPGDAGHPPRKTGS